MKIIYVLYSESYEFLDSAKKRAIPSASRGLEFAMAKALAEDCSHKKSISLKQHD